MLKSLLPNAVSWVFFSLYIALVRRMAPTRFRATEHSYVESQKPEPLATGVVESAMWALGIGIALLFFPLRELNHWWASRDGSSILMQYPTPFIWAFLPGFAALAIPWPLTVWYLRRVGRWEEADAIEDDSDFKGRANTPIE